MNTSLRPVSRQHRTSLSYIIRSFLYGILSATALTAGYAMNQAEPQAFGAMLPLAFLASYFPFFVAYCAVFTRRPGETRPEPRDAFILSIIIFAALAAICLLSLEPQHRPPLHLIALLGPISLIFWSYGWFLLLRYDSIEPRIRHQLVWSVTLAIAVPLYVGISILEVNSSLQFLLPISLLCLLVVISETLKLRKYSLLPISFGLAALPVLMNLAGRPQKNLNTMLGCVVVSAYVAVYEAWAVVNDVASVGDQGTARRYYYGTFVALIISGLGIPIVYLFSDLSPVIVIIFAVHALLAFILWFVGGTDARLRLWPWTTFKILMGSLPLFALVVDTRLFSSVPLTTVPIPMSNVLSTFLAILSTPVLAAVPKVIADWRQHGTVGLFATASRLVGIVFFLTIVGVSLCVVINNMPGRSPAIVARSSQSCLIYVVFWTLSFAYLIYDYFRRRPDPGAAAHLLALCHLFRILTSGLIGFSFVALGIHLGMTLDVAVLRAAPFVLAAMGGFALNDYHDRERDTWNRPYRPIPSGRVTAAQAVFAGRVLLIFAAYTGVVLARSSYEFFIYGFTVLGVALYDVVVAKATVLKNAWTGALAALPLAYFSVQDGVSIMIPVGAAVYVLGREVLMDVIDVEGDLKCGIRTLPARLGTPTSSFFAFSLLALGSTLFSMAVPWPFLIWVLLTAVTTLASIWIFTNPYRPYVPYLLWLPMPFALVVLLAR